MKKGGILNLQEKFYHPISSRVIEKAYPPLELFISKGKEESAHIAGPSCDPGESLLKEKTRTTTAIPICLKKGAWNQLNGRNEDIHLRIGASGEKSINDVRKHEEGKK